MISSDILLKSPSNSTPPDLPTEIKRGLFNEGYSGYKHRLEFLTPELAFLTLRRA
jgi:hypothetical protein